MSAIASGWAARASLTLVLAGTLLLAGTGATAQPVFAIDTVESNRPDLGNVVSGTGADTVFTIAASDGAVTRSSGNGIRIGNGGTRALVTISCSGDDGCLSASETVTIGVAGSPSGRARALTNFTVAAGPNPPSMGTASGTNIVTFTVSGIARDTTRNIYVGADFGIASSGTTGVATSSFEVSVPGSTQSGTARATILRPIALEKLSDLSFGAIVPPRIGTGIVTLDPTAEVPDVSVSGDGTAALSSPAASFAEYEISGEGGQMVSIAIDDVTLTGPGGGMLSVDTTSNVGSTVLLPGSVGSPALFGFRVGGVFEVSHDTPAGAYAGTFEVTVNYQ
jgi:hypothetical protein